MNQDSLGVVWLSSSSKGEQTWLRAVLSKHVNTHDLSADEFLSNPTGPVLIVFHGLQKEPNAQVLEILKKSRSARLFILSDEKLRHSVRRYRGASVILRNYYSPFQAWRKNIFALPLGFTDGYQRGNHFLPFRDRTIPWVFFGQPKNQDRLSMLTAFESLSWPKGSSETHLTKKWNDPGALSPTHVVEKLGRAVFAPCPAGNLNPDTFRLMEALESGAIPVVTRFHGFDYFRLTFGDHPFIVADSWELAAKKCQHLLDNSSVLEGKISDVWSWYERFRKNLQLDVASLVLSGKVSSLVSEQFIYQAQARRSVRIYFAFFRHFRFEVLWPKFLGIVDRLRKRS